MSQFSDLISGPDGVYSLTGRPDLIAETALAVRQATFAAHRSDFYPRDLIDGVQIAVGTAQNNWQLDIPTFFTNWRAMAYVRPYTVASLSLAPLVLGPEQEIAPDAILDDYLTEKLNVWYVAGSNLNIKLEAAYDGLLCSYYANPIISPEANYASWVATDFPAVIILDATRRVLGMIGYEEAAARLTQLLFGASNGSWLNIQGGEAALFKASALKAGGR